MKRYGEKSASSGSNFQQSGSVHMQGSQPGTLEGATGNWEYVKTQGVPFMNT